MNYVFRASEARGRTASRGLLTRSISKSFKSPSPGYNQSSVTEDQILRVLQDFKSGQLGQDDALSRLRELPFEDLGFANIDHHRSLRVGFPEVVFGQGKTAEQVGTIVEAMNKHEHNILVTRSNPEQFARVKQAIPLAEFHEKARAIVVRKDERILGKGKVLVVSAGTSDMPVAEEAVVTLNVMGNEVDFLYDVGVAGLHRLLNRRSRLTDARVVICVAGMEGALPSVVGGLVAVPVIAVPTSVGYGASFNGVAALLGMLNSCASNVTVVNIDNGYGAAVVASLINRQ